MRQAPDSLPQNLRHSVPGSSRPAARWAAVMVISLVGAGALAACGSPAPDGAQPHAEPAPAISIPSDLHLGGEGAPKGSSASSADASPAPSASASDGPGADRCSEMQQAWSATNRALVDLSADHPRALVESFRSGDRAIRSAEPTEEIATAWTSMQDYLDSAVAAFEGIDEDDATAVSTAMADAITADDTADATTAAQDVTEYLSTTCGGR